MKNETNAPVCLIFITICFACQGAERKTLRSLPGLPVHPGQELQDPGLHVRGDGPAVPVQGFAGGPPMAPEVGTQAAVPFQKGKELGQKGQQPPAEMAVEKQQGFSPAELLVKKVQLIPFDRACFFPSKFFDFWRKNGPFLIGSQSFRTYV